MAPTIHHERLEAIRKKLRLEGADGFILSNGDAFFSEYPPEHEKRLEWLTGFTGSAGTVVALDHKQPKRSAFFTDGRYTLQAQQEIDSELYEIHNIAEMSPIEWLKKNAASDTIAYDPWLVSEAQLKGWKETARNIMWVALRPNPIDELWKDRPAPTDAPAFAYPTKYAGHTREQKIADLMKAMKAQNAQAVLLTQPESVNWLLNIRGHDIAHTPVLLCRAIVTNKGEVSLYAPAHKVPKSLREGVTLHHPDELRKHCKAWGKERSILLQSSVTPVRLFRALKSGGANIIDASDPCTLPKAIKNSTELKHIRATHITDGLALTKFLHWLETQSKLPDEISAAEALENFRKESPDYREPSFPTISGFGANGAIVHYRADTKSNAKFHKGHLYLVDSGGQYLGGTTDVTRSVAIGKPSKEMCESYTRVLKGHIALGSAIFPEGTRGCQLDGLARQPLWEAGMDYDHGTGHGVGCYMGVHEGPQGISKRASAVDLRVGMILSNEPGYYKTGAYGIRIENLVEVVAAKRKGFLTFRNLTCVPMDRRLVVKSLLNKQELQWWNDYHQWVWKSLSPSLKGTAKAWLKQACAAL